MTNPVCPTTGAPMQRGVRPMTLDYKRARGLRDAGLVLLCGRREHPYRRGHEGLRPPPSIAFDGLVDAAFFDKMSNQWREEQNRCQREIDRHRSAEQSYMDEGVQILELARNAPRLFERQEPRQKRRLLNFVLSNLAEGLGFEPEHALYMHRF